MIQRWTLTTALPDGHRLFMDDGPVGEKEYAIADDSGHTPDQTDDGVLLLDFLRPLSIESEQRENGGVRHFCSIPLVAQRDECLARTPTDAATLLTLSARFDWAITTANHTYNVTEDAR